MRDTDFYKCNKNLRNIFLKNNGGYQDKADLIRFSNKRHGSPVLSISLPDLLSWDNYKLDELFRRSQKHELNTILFSMEVSGVLRTCSFLCKKAFSIMKKSHKK